MHKILTLLLPIFVGLSLQAQIADDFTDGDFTANPTWSGATGKFIVNATNELQSNGSQASTDTFYLSTPSSILNNVEWILNMKLLFNPTTSNYVKVFLVSDQSDLTGSLNGYFVRMGETGTNDTLELWRKDGATETKILTGNTAYTTTTNASIKVERDNTGNWTMYSDPSAGSTFNMEGTVLDNTHTSTSFFGVYGRYTTTSRFDMYYFDNIVVQTIVADVTPPLMTSVQLISTTQLDVQFNEALDQPSAETSTNYSIAGIGNPSTALLDANQSTVHLTFGTAFSNGSNYQLIANAIADASSNIRAADTINFTYFIPAYRDVIITEIHSDPDAVLLQMPNTEFVEIYNTTTFPIDLTGFEFTDASTTISTLPATTLAPNEYAVICKSTDTSLFTPFGKVIGVSSFPALNNTGDDLELRNGSGTLIDDVSYSDSWYGIIVSDGRTLEIINPNHPCSLSSNWGPSTDSNGGTPAQQNSIYDTTPDTTPPTILGYQLQNDTAIGITFSEPLDFSSVALGDFMISSNAIISLNQGTSLAELELHFSGALTTNLVHELVITSITDCIGNDMGADTIYFGIGVQPTEFSVMIDEILADEDPQIGLPLAEFIELYNISSDIISLQNCIFTDLKDTLIFGNVNILPGDFLIVSSDAQYQLFGDAYISSQMPGINNDGEQLVLSNWAGAVIHTVTYDKTWYRDDLKDDGGWTLEMVDPSNPCSGKSNWSASIDSRGGTPGKVNSINSSNPDLTAPTVDRAIAVSNNVVYLYFDEIMDADNIQTSDFTISGGQQIANTSLENDKKTVLITLSTTLVEKTIYTITVNNVTDCIGNLISPNANSADFALPEQPALGDIIINEILFNPFSGGVDFVEYYNNSDKYINIGDLFILEYAADTIKSIKSITDDIIAVAPGEYVWVTEDIADVTSFYPKAVTTNVIDTDLPSYSDAEGTVAIGFFDNGDTIVADRFDYLDDYHYALIDDDDGVSLERITFSGETNTPSNWHSASSSEGHATPGYQNSQQLNTDGMGDDISIIPEVFTPDNDGMNDFTTFHYAFDDVGYSMTIIIYDAHGRLVKHLVQNELVGRQGFYQWDGIDEQGQKASVGYHVAFIEIFDLNGNIHHFKKKLVVAAQF